MDMTGKSKFLSGFIPGEKTPPPFESTAPDAFVRVYAWENQDTSKMSGLTDTSKTYDIQADILSIDTSKNKQAAGNWNMTLSPSKAYHTIIHPGDWITIHLSNQKIDPKTDFISSIKMLGIVKTVRRVESLNPETGARNVKYLIAGQDFGSCLNMPLYINNELAGTDSNSPELLVISIFHGANSDPNNRMGGPKNLANKFLNLIFNGGPNKEAPVMGQQFRVPSQLMDDLYGKMHGKGTAFTALMQRDFQDLIGKADIHPDLGGTITVFSLMQAYSNSILNEFYTDIFPDPDGEGDCAPTMVLRAIPFSKEKGKIYGQCLSIKSGDKAGPKQGDHKLYVSKNIYESQILQMNYGKSDAERFNFFLAVPNQVDKSVEKTATATMVQKKGLKGLSDVHSIKRYGIRPYIANSIFLIKDPKAFALFNDVVKDMWKRAVLFDNGLVELTGTAEHIPVGTNIKFADRDWLAHVEQVTYSYKVEPFSGRKNYRTTVAFVRLQDLQGEPLFLKTEPAQQDYDPGISTSEKEEVQSLGIASLTDFSKLV